MKKLIVANMNALNYSQDAFCFKLDFFSLTDSSPENPPLKKHSQNYLRIPGKKVNGLVKLTEL